MNDWLSKIKFEEYDESRTIIWDDDGERMIRVLREFAAYIELENSLPMKYETEEAAQTAYDASRHLSDDAMALLMSAK